MKTRSNVSIASAVLMAALTSRGAAQAQSTIEVSTEPQLQAAITSANSAGGNVTIVLDDGTYTLSNTLYVNAPNVTIEGKSGIRENVIIQGDAMSATAQIGDLIRVDGSNFQLHFVTLQKSGWHLIQIVGNDNVDNPVITDCVLRDAYQQMIKVTDDPSAPNVTSDNGLVENCVFEYTAGIGPEYYIGGIDAHAATNWVVRGNTFRYIASPSGSVAEFAIHFWDRSANNLVEKNLIIDCDRGIGFGLDGAPANQGGIIRNNMIYHSAGGGTFADVGIGLAHSPNSQVYNNTVYMEDAFPWGIEYRYVDTVNVAITNNLSNKPIQARDGGTAVLTDNVLDADPSWFVSPSEGNLHLAYAVSGVVDAGVPVSGLTDDIDGQARPNGPGIDIGADEYYSSVLPMPPTKLSVF